MQSVDGRSKDAKTSKEISIDVSKILWSVNSVELKWNSLLETKGLLRYFELLKSLGVKASGRCMKMERCGDALRYMRFLLRAKEEEEEASGDLAQRYAAMFSQITSVEEKLSAWKSTERKEKKRADVHRLEMQSDEMPPLETLNTFLDNDKMKKMFNDIVSDVSACSLFFQEL